MILRTTNAAGAEHATAIASRITGWGMAVPEQVVPNSHFERYLATSDQWIRERTGIAERRWAEPGVVASDLAEPACRQAIERAGLQLDDIDAIICATVTPDYVFPSTACVLQKRLGMERGFAFDLNAVCSGFLYALTTADSFIANGLASQVLVVGVDLFSRLIDPNDRSTCILFGDGAGAVVLSAVGGRTVAGKAVFEASRGRPTADQGTSGIYGSDLQSDGRLGELLCAPGGAAEQYLTMAGREVFKVAVRSLCEVSERLLQRLGFSVADVDHFVSHQANQRILAAMARQLGVSEEKVLSNVAKYGNTSAASVPILLAEAADAGTIKKGDLLLVSAVGGGMTWGAVLVRW